jgi:hypothetical protein
MKEYRARLGVSFDAISQNSANDSANKPGFMSLAEVYGLEEDMMIGSERRQAHSVDQEYSEYVSAVLSAPSVDILKFWEASTPSSLINLTPCHGSSDFRSTAHPSPLCMPSQWITFQFRHQRYHVRGCSPQVLRQIPSGAIESIPYSWKHCKC